VKHLVFVSGILLALVAGCSSAASQPSQPASTPTPPSSRSGSPTFPSQPPTTATPDFTCHPYVWPGSVKHFAVTVTNPGTSTVTGPSKLAGIGLSSGYRMCSLRGCGA